MVENPDVIPPDGQPWSVSPPRPALSRSPASSASCARTTATLSPMLCVFSGSVSSFVDPCRHSVLVTTIPSKVRTSSRPLRVSGPRHYLTNAPSKRRSLLRLTAKATQFGKRTFTSWLIESAGTVPIKRRSDYSEDAQVDNTEIMSHLMDVRIPTALVRRPFRNLIFSRFRYWDLEMPSVSFRKGKAVTILPWLP